MKMLTIIRDTVVRNETLLSGLLFLFAVVSLFSLASQPSLGTGSEGLVTNGGVRVICHVVVYFVLSGLYWKAIPKNICAVWVKIVLCIAVVTLVGAMDEIHQTTIPGRGGTIIGFSYDLIGIFLFVGTNMFRNSRIWRHPERQNRQLSRMPPG